MLNIEITTTQNVTIQQELASVTDRFLAAIIDSIIIFFLIWLGIFLIEDLFDGTQTGYLIILLFYALPFIFFYTFLSETMFNGQTLGKKLLKIKVIRLDGKPLNVIDHFSRWSTRMVDIWFSGTSLGAILIISSDHRQRLGGMISGTVVIRETQKHYFSLEKIKGLSSLDKHIIKYPEVKSLSEEQMLSLKKLLSRHKKYKTKVYKNMIAESAKNIQKSLKIESKSEPGLFIQQVLKDYIVLSR